MTEKPICDPAALRQLLGVVDRDPVELVEAIRREREACIFDDRLHRHLDRLELGFLTQQARATPTGAATAEFRDALDAATASARAFALRSATATDERHPSLLFDLVELRVALTIAGETASAAAVTPVLDERIATVAQGPELDEEARERFAVLAAEAEDLPLPHRIALLDATSDVLARLSQRTGSKPLRKLSRRLASLAADRRLALRLERLLTRRGVVALETTSLVLLVVVFTLLGVQMTVELEPSTQRTLLLVDGFACLYFLAEFALKLSLAPARGSWFLRNALTDLLPALPAALLLFHAPIAPGAEDAVLVRLGRLLRITWFARYVHALRPLLSVLRLLLFLVKGLDSMVRRLRPVLNRDFVFFERELTPRAHDAKPDRVETVFQALRREQAVLSALPEPRRTTCLAARARHLAQRLDAAPPSADRLPSLAVARAEVPVEDAIETMHAMTPAQLAWSMPRRDLDALDRVVRVLSAPVVRWLPFVRRVALRRPPPTPEERVVAAGRRVATWVESWRERILWYADLHGILTGPQVLDRVASAMIQATQRPAVRLLMFGAAFLLVRALIGERGFLSDFLRRFVATPLLLFGGFCMVFLLLGKWLKRLAGEASETLKRTSEANFIALLELGKRRHEARDLTFLASRLFRVELTPERGGELLRAQLERYRGADRASVAPAPTDLPAGVREDVHRVALMYLHFLGGAVLHESDVKTSEQLLANLSLENIRSDHIVHGRRERKRLRNLSLDRGSLFSGPYLWFQFITESVALETAKRILDYNRHCLPLDRRALARPEQITAHERWLHRKSTELGGRSLERVATPAATETFATTEWNALDFLAPDTEREQHLRAVFGDDVVALMLRDRRAMIREIFGTKPLHRLARSKRTLNVFLLYQRRLSRGRILLVPLLAMWLGMRTFGAMVARTAGIVREILDPSGARRNRVVGSASFAVALRKIHRMKAPGLIEAMRLRVAFDPAYCGVPTTWSFEARIDARPEVERDLDFLHVKERERAAIRAQADAVRACVLEWHALRRSLAPFDVPPDPIAARQAERAVTIAFATDSRSVRTLLHGDDWLEGTLAVACDARTRLAPMRLRGCWQWLARTGRIHPVDQLLAAHVRDPVDARTRGNLVRMWRADLPGFRATLLAWLQLAPGERARATAVRRLREVHADHQAITRELTALRAVQSLSVLDVRNYRDLVFRLGGYADDGEDASLAESLP